MPFCKLVTSLVIIFSFESVKADLFDEVSPPPQEITNLEDFLGAVDIVDEGDINSDGVADYIVRYKDSASNYGEFLYNVIVSDGSSYHRGFIYDDYFIELYFDNCIVIGSGRDGATTITKQRYFYDASKKVLKEIADTKSRS